MKKSSVNKHPGKSTAATPAMLCYASVNTSSQISSPKTMSLAGTPVTLLDGPPSTQGQEADLAKVFTYERTSTTRQVQKEGEIDDMRKHAIRILVENHQSKGWTLSGSIVDVAQSGDNPHREGLQHLRAAARRREFDVLLIFDQGQLARDWKTVKKLIRELEALGVQIYAANGTQITHKTVEGVTTSMTLALMSELTSESTRSGGIRDIAATAGMGKWPGVRAPLGYLAVKGSSRGRYLVRDLAGFNPHSTEILIRLAGDEPASAIIADFAERGIQAPSMLVKKNGVGVKMGCQPVALKHIESIVGNPVHMGCIAVAQYASATETGGAGLPAPDNFLPDGTAIYKGVYEPSVTEEIWFKAHRNFFRDDGHAMTSKHS